MWIRGVILVIGYPVTQLPCPVNTHFHNSVKQSDDSCITAARVPSFGLCTPNLHLPSVLPQTLRGRELTFSQNPTRLLSHADWR
jgi:hypothetical protein